MVPSALDVLIKLQRSPSESLEDFDGTDPHLLRMIVKTFASGLTYKEQAERG